MKTRLRVSHQPSTEDLVALLESTLEKVSEGVIITAVDGRILYYNKALEKIEGLKSRDVINRHLTEVYRVTPETSEHLKVVKTGEPFREMTKVFFTADGREISLISSTYPVHHRGRMVGAFSVCRDITKLKGLLNENLILQQQAKGENTGPSFKGNGTRYTFADFVYASELMEKLVQQAEKAAKSNGAVLVHGETGTGKEILVQSIHNASANRDKPFVGINCAAIPDTLLESILFGTVKGAFTGAVDSPGLIEQAGQGTLFLDEINAMSQSLQAKLLRMLQERTFRRIGGSKEIPVNCRIMASTNLDPLECVRKGTLREDLYYRLAVFPLFIPPLRERREDIEALLDHFCSRFAREYGHGHVQLDPGLQKAFLGYRWPGNVRELEHTLESCLAMLEPGEHLVTFDQLPSSIRLRFIRHKLQPRVNLEQPRGLFHEIMEDLERQVIEEVLKSNRGNISKAAKALGILRQNLQYRMRKLGIKAENYRLPGANEG